MTKELSISRGELVHHQMQAIMREQHFESNQLMYLGIRDGQHWYLIAGEHEVSAEQIEGMEQVEETNE